MSNNPQKGLADDHGHALFAAAKKDRLHDAAGKPRHERGRSREHTKAELPAVPWARSERVAPHESSSEGFVVASLPSTSPNHRSRPATPRSGEGEIGNPDYAPTAPRRRVAGKSGLHLHEEHVPAELRRAKLPAGHSHAISAKLKSELLAAERSRGIVRTGHSKTVKEGAERRHEPEAKNRPADSAEFIALGKALGKARGSHDTMGSEY